MPFSANGLKERAMMSTRETSTGWRSKSVSLVGHCSTSEPCVLSCKTKCVDGMPAVDFVT